MSCSAARGPNTYSDLTRVSGGRLIIEKDGALGLAGSSSSTTSNTFQLAGSQSTIAFRAPTGSGGFDYNTFEVINTSGTGTRALDGSTILAATIRLLETLRSIDRLRPGHGKCRLVSLAAA